MRGSSRFSRFRPGLWKRSVIRSGAANRSSAKYPRDLDRFAEELRLHPKGVVCARFDRQRSPSCTLCPSSSLDAVVAPTVASCQADWGERCSLLTDGPARGPSVAIQPLRMSQYSVQYSSWPQVSHTRRRLPRPSPAASPATFRSTSTPRARTSPATPLTSRRSRLIATTRTASRSVGGSSIPSIRIPKRAGGSAETRGAPGRLGSWKTASFAAIPCSLV